MSKKMMLLDTFFASVFCALFSVAIVAFITYRGSLNGFSPTYIFLQFMFAFLGVMIPLSVYNLFIAHKLVVRRKK